MTMTDGEFYFFLLTGELFFVQCQAELRVIRNETWIIDFYVKIDNKRKGIEVWSRESFFSNRYRLRDIFCSE